MAATVFPMLFFNDMSPAIALLASFATFGVGFVARPLGGIVFGHLGDRLGRRKILLTTFILMGVASMVIGLLPPHSAIGIAAPALLVLMRFIQGIALGGEATGAQLMTMEHAPADRRAFYGALMAMGSPISQVAANLMLAVLSGVLSPDAFLSWGWRVPFLLSILLVAVGIYIRLKVEETPVFKEGMQEIAQRIHQSRHRDQDPRRHHPAADPRLRPDRRDLLHRLACSASATSPPTASRRARPSRSS